MAHSERYLESSVALKGIAALARSGPIAPAVDADSVAGSVLADTPSPHRVLLVQLH